MIALTHPIKQMISSQYGFILSMLDRFPSLLDEWLEKQKVEVEQIAQEYAEGDYEVYRDTYNSEISRVDSCYDEEQLFNQAMLIMVYSYYESIICRLAKECNAKKECPSAIVEAKSATLEDEFLIISKFLYESILPLRNELCHNNNGTLFERKHANEKAIEQLEKKGYISVDDGRINISDRDFIKRTLDSEYKLLIKLAEICGFKTKWYVFKDGSTVIYDSYEKIPKDM